MKARKIKIEPTSQEITSCTRKSEANADDIFVLHERNSSIVNTIGCSFVVAGKKKVSTFLVIDFGYIDVITRDEMISIRMQLDQMMLGYRAHGKGNGQEG